jgi:organic radical activating enzyme
MKHLEAFDINNNLYISQMIPTIQCEGKFIGTPSLLIRLGGCNCNCPWCDTKNALNLNNCENIINNQKSYNDFINNIHEINNKYPGIKNIMITGGEPLIYINNKYFRKLIEFIILCSYTIEFETNGSLIYKIEFENFSWIFNKEYKSFIHFNISPKLNSKYYHDSFDFCMLSASIQYIDNQNGNYILKFVNDNNLDVIEKFLTFLNLKNHENSYIMPLTPDINKYKDINDFYKDFEKQCNETLNICLKNNFIYSPRLQLYLFGKDKEEKI